MSGGFVNEKGLKAGDHQVVIFTFKGPTTGADSVAWNVSIRALKRAFETNSPGCLIGVTLSGLPSPGPTAFGDKKKPSAARGRRRSRGRGR